MAGPTQAPQGVTTIEVVSANLFQVAEQYLGDATAWGRIADLNGYPGVEPDFLITAPTTLKIPPKGAAGVDLAEVSVERLLFGADA